MHTERYKLIHYYEEPQEWEMYDLQSDPGELHNLYDHPAHAKTVAQLKTRIAELRKEYGDTAEA